ncbi:MAG: hypothetical protein IJR06_06200 [Paludibacteraceae bacterium]|nr:hypothetical protein [Paludibacteraceae bacterium]
MTLQIAFAEDVIYLTNGDEIKSLVSEVTSTTVKYKKFSNVDGPTYTINKSDILMIIYANGEKDIFISSNAKKEPLQQDYSANNTIQNSSEPNRPVGVISYMGDKPTAYNGKPIEEFQYIDIAKTNCPAAYTQYIKGSELKVGGNVLLSLGVPITAAGIACLIAGACVYNPNYSYSGNLLYISGIVFTCVGAPIMITGIPLHCIGKTMKKRSFDTYNKNASQISCVPELQFKLMSNGVGLGMVF